MKKLVLVVFFVFCFVGVAVAAGKPYYEDSHNNYVATRDHFLAVTLEAGVVVGFQIEKGGSFHLASLYQEGAELTTPVSQAEYEACGLQRQAIGRNAVVLQVRQIRKEMADIKNEVRRREREKKNNPDFAERLRREAEEELRHEARRQLRRMFRRW